MPAELGTLQSLSQVHTAGSDALVAAARAAAAAAAQPTNPVERVITSIIPGKHPPSQQGLGDFSCCSQHVPMQ